MTLAIAALLLVALFTFTWWLSVRLENYSFVDVTWALSFAHASSACEKLAVGRSRGG